MRLSCGFLLLVLARAYALGAARDWPSVGGDSGCSRYSTLEQINRGNVVRLEAAWSYHCGDKGDAGTIECTPIVVDRVMYLTTGGSKAVELDAGTGREVWKFDPYDSEMPASASSSRKAGRLQPKASGGVNRGLAY